LTGGGAGLLPSPLSLSRSSFAYTFGAVASLSLFAPDPGGGVPKRGRCGGRGRWRQRGLVPHLPPLPVASFTLLWYLLKLLVWARIARSIWPKT
ncbi:hypothetical protein U1Q18_007460, partial [Sarracenia purpurea var. burkii]